MFSAKRKHAGWHRPAGLRQPPVPAIAPVISADASTSRVAMSHLRPSGPQRFPADVTSRPVARLLLLILKGYRRRAARRQIGCQPYRARMSFERVLAGRKCGTLPSSLLKAGRTVLHINEFTLSRYSELRISGSAVHTGSWTMLDPCEVVA